MEIPWVPPAPGHIQPHYRVLATNPYLPPQLLTDHMSLGVWAQIGMEGA